MPATIHTPAVVLDHVTFSWPDGSRALTDLSGSLGAGRTGLVGRNGSGKSTLLHLIAGGLSPSGGTITRPTTVATLPQRLTLDVERPVADLLGVGGALRALRAIEDGDADPRHFDAVGRDWDVEARAHAALAEAGLAPAMLERAVGELSGGEAVLAAIAGIRLSSPDLTLLDEPTNNLDRDARAHLAGMVRSWRGALVVVSHDTALLELVDDTAELHDGALTTFGGPYSQWRAHLEAEQDAARRAERDAAQALRREKRQRIEAETTLAHRAAMGRKAQLDKRVPKIVAGGRRMAAQVSAGKLRGEKADREAAARAALDSAGRRVRDDGAIRIDLPDPGVAASRRIATVGGWVLQGPERMALVGANGVGKTTLLEALIADAQPSETPLPGGGSVRMQRHTDRVAYLPQRVDGLDEDASALDELHRAAPSASAAELRNRLARLHLRGGTALRAIGTLSGGERFRVALARMLLAEPPAQLLVFDEPTNNLDIDTVDRFVEALSAYRGAVLVVSHDDAFLARIGLARRLELGRDGALTER